jgi:DNA-binding MarR family transcriptional regulator
MAQRSTSRERRRGTAPTGADSELGRELRRLTRSIQLLERAALRDQATTRAQAHALLTIQAMARPSMAMLARELDLAPSTVTRLIDPLVRQGLVERQPDPDDRRVVGVVLTAAGRRTLRSLEQSLHAAYAALAAAIPPSEQSRTLELLGHLRQAIERATFGLG